MKNVVAAIASMVEPVRTEPVFVLRGSEESFVSTVSIRNLKECYLRVA